MSRITKLIAENVAVKLTEKQNTEIKELKAELSNKFTEIYLKIIPQEVFNVFKKHRNFFKERQSVQIAGNGFQWQSIEFNKSLPYTNSTFTPNENDAKLLLSLLDKIEDKKSELSKLKQEITALVFNLGTYAKVNSEFPEATPFLPIIKSTALMINISDLRKKLK